MSLTSNNYRFEFTFYCYILIYRSILEKKKYEEDFISFFLTFLRFIIEKYYFEREYIIEPECSFFDCIKGYLKEKF